MVPTKDVAGVERFVQVMVSTMAAAKNYSQDWPVSAFAVLAAIRREFSAELLRILARPFEELEETKPSVASPVLAGQRGIVLAKRWGMSSHYEGSHIICLRRDREFVVISQHKGWIGSGDELVARVIGSRDYPGNISASSRP